MPPPRPRDPATGRLRSNEDVRREAQVAEALSGGRDHDHDDDYVQVEAAMPARRRPFERKPFGNQDQKLRYPNREGYHRHWFNDEPGRIMRAREAGYEQVNDEDGRPVSTVVGIGRGGQALVAFLMEIPQEWFEQDMAAQEKVTHGLMEQIGQGEHSRPKGSDGELRYSRNIKIETGNSRR